MHRYGGATCFRYPKGSRKVTTTNLTIGGMTCNGCERAVKAALMGLPGVASVSADAEKGTAVVEAQRELDRQAVSKALEEAGYVLK